MRWSLSLALGTLGAVGLVAMGSAFGFARMAVQNTAAGVVQSFGAANITAGTVLTAAPTAGTTTAGDLLVATITTRVITVPAATVAGVTDSATNTWVRATSLPSPNKNDEEIWYAANANSDASVTVTLSVGAAAAFTVVEVGGAATTPLDRTTADVGSSMAPSIGLTTPTSQAAEIVIADTGWNTSLTPAAPTLGYTTTPVEQSTVIKSQAGEQAAWQVLSAVSTPTYGAMLSASVTWTGALATFDLGAVSPTPTPSPTGSPAPTPTATPAPGTPHVMLIVEENRSYGNIIGSANAPYLSTLASTYASATNWYAVQHTSEDDYVELLSGSNQGLPAGKPYAATTLVDELHAGNIPWKAYMESMPSNCFKGAPPTNALYDQFHNPFHYFTNDTATAGGWCSPANLTTEGIVPYPGASGLVSALDATSAPDFVELVPNDCDEMHGDKATGSPCATSTQAQLIAAGDTWLSTNIGPVISSPWFAHNGTIIITWDESSSTDNTGCCNLLAPGGHIPTIVITSKNKGLGQFTDIGDNYGTLAAIENAYGVPLLLNAASAVNGDLSGAFAAPSGGSIAGTVTNATTKAGIAGATVTYTGLSGGGTTTTGSSGTYSFGNVPGGSYTESVTATGYTAQTGTAFTVKSGVTTTQDFQLLAIAKSLSVAQTFGAGGSGTVGSTTLSASTGTATGSGDLLVVTVRARGASSSPTVTAISDNSSGLDTWKQATRASGTSDADAEIWYSTDAASVTTVTATVSTTSALAMTVLDIAGASATPLDQVMTASGAGTAATTGATAVTTDSREIAVADIGWNGATNTYPLGGATAGYVTAPTAFWQSTVSANRAGEEAAWLILSATGTQRFAVTLKASGAWTGAIATFG